MELLNRIVLGPNAGIFPERGFYAVDKSKLGNPDYDPKFFEAFPSLWANAYAFQKAIEPPRTRDPLAVEEWVSLFFLYFFGVLHLETYDSDRIVREYDEDLWTALSGTYLEHDLPAVRLLKTSDGVVVGGYYPKVVFFPSRGRASWHSSRSLILYLDGNRLSWRKCKENLLTEQNAINRFHGRLNAIAQAALEGDVREAIASFIRTEPIFENAYSPIEYLDLDPDRWPPYDEPTEEKLLANYPLQNTRDGKRTYYLVSGFPYLAEWMSTPIAPGMPAPVDYTKADDVTLRVDFGGRTLDCALRPGERIEFLRDLFLSGDSFGSVLEGDSINRVSKASPFHNIRVGDGKKAFALNNKGKFLICLAPLQISFAEAFPEILSEEPKKITATLRSDRDVATVDWSLTILNREVNWTSTVAVQEKLSLSLISVWPAKVSMDWRLYVARGTGTSEDAGRWALIDENGEPGDVYQLSEDEYVSVLNDEKRPNRPRAMLLKDAAGAERGVLFLTLNPYDDVSVGKLKKATLAVDFGTSNTCMAVKIHGDLSDPPQPVIFSQSSAILWGEIPKTTSVTPVFAPFAWAGKKGFFPTVLLVRRSSTNLARVSPENLELKDLFHAAIPGLHNGLDNRTYIRTASSWELHSNLKWHRNPDLPYRAVFLWLSLIYAHAEVRFRYQAEVQDYVFTVPLALSDKDRTDFDSEAKTMVERTRRHCYGDQAVGDVDSMYYAVDESSAIARSALAPGNPDSLEVFIDLGGGTADIAIRHDADCVVLDSIPVAGAAFFKFANKNFSPPPWYDPLGADEFAKSLSLLLPESFSPGEKNLRRVLKETSELIPLATYYTLLINPLDDQEFKRRERLVLDHGMGRLSFQKFWTQSLLRHVIAYALLQACAAIVNRELRVPKGITLKLAGNAWALMMFAGLDRTSDVLMRESKDILDILKLRLSEHSETKHLLHEIKDSLRIFSVDLLNEKVIGEGKTALARGAVLLSLDRTLRREGVVEVNPPFSGVTFSDVKINDEGPITIRWCDRWHHEDFATILRRSGWEGVVREMRLSIGPGGEKGGAITPLDPLLEGFVQLCNVKNFKEGQLEAEEWHQINSRLLNADQYLDNSLNPKQPPVSVFLSKILYSENDEYPYMENLAIRNLTPGKSKPRSKTRAGEEAGTERDVAAKAGTRSRAKQSPPVPKDE